MLLWSISGNALGQNKKFPKIIVIDDTARVAITFDQVDSMNVTTVRLDKCQEAKDSLNSTIDEYEDVIAEDSVLLQKAEDSLPRQPA